MNICVHEQLLIGYNRGLIVLWDCKNNKAEHMYNAAQVLVPYFSLLMHLFYFIYNQIIHTVQQSKTKTKSKLHSCQVIYSAAKFISR